ncbi:hypothetical protein TorRG33x02_263840 [Trema orientale]|uniref:Uncharacterized protein n=1 Tax=Trema orientale TaxID=63057 RepID=A0A2P5D3B8_TREOI|nr:hypothetical protein TorRG33x02_263840 [Trema orientale]
MLNGLQNNMELAFVHSTMMVPSKHPHNI